MATDCAEESTEAIQDPTDPSSIPVDITEIFFSACRVGLEPGELLHESWFDLQYSMSAIEIMDPKMDARIQGGRRVLTILEALSTNQLPLGPFTSLSLLVGIMDELLSAFVNWLTGDSLAQSIFICMYMHCTPLVIDKYLVAFCESLRRIVFQLRHIIIAVGVFDEEDHYTFIHGMPIEQPHPVYYYCYMSNEDSSYVCRMTTIELITHVNDLYTNLENDSSVFSDREENLLAGLRSRLQFVHCLLLFTNPFFERVISAIREFQPDDFEGYTKIDFDAGETASLSKVSEIQDNAIVPWDSFICFCRGISQHISGLKSLSNKLLETAYIGEKAGEGKHRPKDATYGLPGFEVFLNQTSVPSYMPKVVDIHDRHKSFAYFSNLFTRLEHILCTYETFSLWHKLYPDPLRLQSLWAFIQKSGQISCSYVKDLLLHDNCSEVNEPTLSTCVLSRTITYMLYFVLMSQEDISDFKPQSFSPVNFHCFLNSWSQIECTAYRPLIKDIISKTPELTSFFTTLSNHFAHIPAIYCLNRSRQRSALAPWLQRLPDLLEECARAEFVIGIELINVLSNNTSAKSFESQGEFGIPSSQLSVPVEIHLSHFVTYVYYYLAWDYVISGFQLDLYSPNEWLFIYAFMIHLFRNISDIINRLAQNHTFLTSVKAVDVGNKSTENETIKYDPVNGAEIAEIRKRKKKKKHKEKGNTSAMNTNSIETPHMNSDCTIKPMPPMIHEIGSVFEAYVINIHQYINTASLYAIRALQRDSGIEINENVQNSNSPDNTLPHSFINRTTCLESYARRLGIFLIPQNSPLTELGLCDKCDNDLCIITSRVTSIIPTSVILSTL
ncbi:unnamed protein product [Trichobilharzia szidati]|nr:unnamed protein product [Trichobilharzia szidati]